MGTADWYRERLNIEVNTSASWSAHPLTLLGILSGPGDFCEFTLLRAILMSVVRDRVASSSSASLTVGMVLLTSNRASKVLSSLVREVGCWASLLFLPL